MDGPQHLLEPWLQRLEHCPGAALNGELLRTSPTPWQRLCSHLGGDIFIARAGFGCRWPQ